MGFAEHRLQTIDQMIMSSTKLLEIINRFDLYPDRYAFIETPPILSGADALALASLVDHIIIVVQAGATQEDDVKKYVSHPAFRTNLAGLAGGSTGFLASSKPRKRN